MPTRVNEVAPVPPPAYHREQARLGLDTGGAPTPMLILVMPQLSILARFYAIIASIR